MAEKHEETLLEAIHRLIPEDDFEGWQPVISPGSYRWHELVSNPEIEAICLDCDQPGLHAHKKKK